MTSYGDILWTPSPKRVAQAAITSLMQEVERRYGANVKTYPELHKWSVEHMEQFWWDVATFTKIIWQKNPTAAFTPPASGRMLGGSWFPSGQLNYAENALWAPDHQLAIMSHCESGIKRTLTYQTLREEVRKCRNALKANGVTKGDRVAGVLANVPEAIIAMLATASLGAIWSSCSPDFGSAGVLDRLSQIEPKVIFISKSYDYNGKHFVLDELQENLKTSLQNSPLFVTVDHLSTQNS